MKGDGRNRRQHFIHTDAERGRQRGRRGERRRQLADCGLSKTDCREERIGNFSRCHTLGCERVGRRGEQIGRGREIGHAANRKIGSALHELEYVVLRHASRDGLIECRDDFGLCDANFIREGAHIFAQLSEAFLAELWQQCLNFPQALVDLSRHLHRCDPDARDSKTGTNRTQLGDPREFGQAGL